MGMDVEKQRVRQPREDEADRLESDADPEQQEVEIEALVGESEHSLVAAGRHERGTTARAKAGATHPEPLSRDPDELGRRFLEGAAQAPALVRDEREEVRFPGDTDEDPSDSAGDLPVEEEDVE